MDNHYHLCIETTDPTFSRGMRHLNGLFTQWHNAQHHSVGHILQGRFKAFLIEEESYLLNVVRYIVLNPVRAGMVSDPAVYQWSRYRALAGLERASDWLTLDNILGRFGKERTRRNTDIVIMFWKVLVYHLRLMSFRRGLFLAQINLLTNKKSVLNASKQLKTFLP